MDNKEDLKNQEVLFKGFRKHPYLFIFAILILLLGTTFILFIIPINWIILAGLYEGIKNGTIFQKIISILLIILYISGILKLSDALCDD